ncbi:MAG: guanylate kinase [Caulobacterales bacterium]|jgi:guanylate kinase|nr:guanylate kinase [Caulobacterales bacterium]
MLNEHVARRGLMFVLSSPSGAGKSTLARKLLDADDNMSLSVSATTRAARPSEVDGREYKFMQREAFEEMADRGEFLEHALVFGNHYGTPRAPVEAMLIQGKDVLFDVDWQGARALRAAEPQDVVGIFILPPSMAELERRLHARAEDSEEVINRRMARSLDEISHWEEYDYVLVNTLLEQTLTQIRQILAAERLKRARQLWLKLHVERLKQGI